MLRDSRDIIRRLEADGFVLVSARGSHQKYKHPSRGAVVILPHPRRDIPSGRCILSTSKQAGRRTEL
jgi:predicted RNA binding protein YcfA (HicA-like mRNA interferase family)